MKCDVLVLGGGGAGLAAAIMAARQGAHTVLVERHGMLGGMATAALVHSVCGLYLLREEPGAVLAHRGFPSEFAGRLIHAGAATGAVRMGRLDVLPHSPPGFAAVCDVATAECGSLEVWLHTEVISATGTASIGEVTTITRGERRTLEPTAVVETSGDGVLAPLLGLAAQVAPAGQLQRPAFICALHGVEVASLHGEGRMQLAHQIAGAVRAGLLPAGALGAHFRASQRGSEVYVTIDLAGGLDYDPTHARQLAALEREGRLLGVELTRYLRATHPAFAQVEIGAFPARVGVRESRRLQGRTTVTQEDVLRGTPHPEVVALGTWPIELREQHTGPRWRFPEANRPTQIPLGALQALAVENLWMAGRCLSCDHEAQAALRVIGTCLATGQAAGLAAAWQAAHGTCPQAQDIEACLRSAPDPFT